MTQQSTRRVERKELQRFLIEAELAGSRIVAMTPTMLTRFGSSPERYEVSEYLIVTEPKEKR